MISEFLSYTICTYVDLKCLEFPLSEEPNFGTWRIEARVIVGHFQLNNATTHAIHNIFLAAAK